MRLSSRCTPAGKRDGAGRGLFVSVVSEGIEHELGWEGAMVSREQLGKWTLRVLWGLGAILASFSIAVHLYGSSFGRQNFDFVFLLLNLFFLIPAFAWLLLPVAWRRMRPRYVGLLTAVCLPIWCGAGIPLGIQDFDTLVFTVFAAGWILLVLFWRRSRHRFWVASLLVAAWLLGAALGAALVSAHIDPFAQKFSSFPTSFPFLFLVAVVNGFVALPLLWAMGCGVASRKGVMRHLVWGVYLLALLGALVSPGMLYPWEQCPKKVVPREALVVTADRLEDKEPEFVDADAFWVDLEPENETGSPMRCLVNKTPAVYGLRMITFQRSESETEDRLYASYAEAIREGRRDLPVLPSLQMMQHKTKVFEDRFVAAMEAHLFLHSPSLGGGVSGIAARLLDVLRETEAGSAERDAALAFLAAGLHLGGGELPALPEEVERERVATEELFLGDPKISEPIGFHTDTAELANVFRQGRFFQRGAGTRTGAKIAGVLRDASALREQYALLLALNSKLNNPGASFSVSDLLPYLHLGGDPEALNQALLDSPRGIALRERYDLQKAKIALVPAATSRETELFARRYSGSTTLPWENVMNRFINTVRRGELSLAPVEDSGWYDYKSYALEPLLLPERAQEEDKLLLQADYKKHLLEAFKTAITQQRETHMMAHPPVKTMGFGDPSPPPPPHFRVTPELSVEPNATYLLRTARAFRFVLASLRSLLPEEELRDIWLGEGGRLPEATEEIMRLFYGLYLQVCADIGMRPVLEEGELDGHGAKELRENAKRWLEQIEDDPIFEEDTRYAVPILVAPLEGKARYWLTVGVTMVRLHVGFARAPALRFHDEDSGEILFETEPGTEEDRRLDQARDWARPRGIQIKGSGRTYLLPVQVFTEANGPVEPPTRAEFRALCDRHKNQKAIVRAMAGHGRYPWWKLGVAAGVVIAVVAFLLLVRKLARDRGRRRDFLTG